MCDYSLEMYKSVPAEQGETYQLHRFPSGTMGFIKPADTECAVCLSKDTQLHLEGIDATCQRTLGVPASDNVVFVKFDNTGTAHKDGVCFSNGNKVLLQSLNSGIVCTLLPEDTSLASDAPVETPDLIDAD